MSTAEDFLVASDNANDYADSLIDGLRQQALEDIDELFNDETSRDTELWNEFDAPDELSIKDFDSVPEDERDLDWVEGIAGISAAALAQFFLMNREETLILPLAYREQVVGGLTISKAEVMRAAKRGFEVTRNVPFATIQAARLEELAYIRAMSNVELFNTLAEVGALRSPEKMIADSIGYVSRMTNYRPDSPQFKEAVANLVNTNSTRALKSINRRSVESMYSFRAANGDLNTLMVWVVEFGPGTCSYCEARAGSIGTYAEFIESGLPGADICKGGDLCNCHLEAV